MVFADLFDSIIDTWISLSDKIIGLTLGRDRILALGPKIIGDERTEKLDSPLTGETAFIHVKGRTDGNDGTSGIVDTLTKKVLTEAALFALQLGA